MMMVVMKGSYDGVLTEVMFSSCGVKPYIL